MVNSNNTPAVVTRRQWEWSQEIDAHSLKWALWWGKRTKSTRGLVSQILLWLALMTRPNALIDAPMHTFPKETIADPEIRF